MTVPEERTAAVQRADRFLFALCNRHCWKEVYPDTPWPKVPKVVRDLARSIHRHYPGAHYLRRASEKMPDDWGKPHEKE